ncbi:TPR and ankyrin repeat-containing protein 1, partial [Jatropha curcas]|uniref:TPR and ankyrin repeat-containing protein 1 n=1 Tax=Jatropha curcas TaxID=180498 RepID=UPI0018960DE7
MQEELNQFEINQVWKLVSRPKNHSVIGSKWVFRNKLDEQGNVVRNKARLVALGYNQEEGIDFDETFAPVLMMLDGTIGNSYFERFPDVRQFLHGKMGSLESIALQTFITTREVNYDKFCSIYWPRFNTQMTKKLDSSRVFTEIMSHIKGDFRTQCWQVSKIFHLSQNFRTHAGILKLAQSVIDLLYRFFPSFVDILSHETSLIFGEAPVWLEATNDENAIVTIFGSSGNEGTNFVGFGAEQVILVRDDSAKKEVYDYVGKQALVLTIMECRGLEFQDVLLYNFFGSSPPRNNWRVVFEYMKEQNLLDESSPVFNMAKHNVLCSELKQLYVAITRTRQRLWICENLEEFSKPMFDYWKMKALIQVRTLDDLIAQGMQVSSS